MYIYIYRYRYMHLNISFPYLIEGHVLVLVTLLHIYSLHVVGQRVTFLRYWTILSCKTQEETSGYKHIKTAVHNFL